MNTSTKAAELARLATELRISIIDMLTEAKSGHPGGSLSAIDLMTALWFHEMRGVDPLLTSKRIAIISSSPKVMASRHSTPAWQQKDLFPKTSS